MHSAVLFKLALQSLVGTVMLVLSITVTFGAVRSSTNYQIQSDSINIGGGYSSSTNYQQESTIGEIATGRSDSTTYSLRAGYQQMQEVYVAITSPANVVMSPSIGGISGGTSNGSTAVRVTTDSVAGYQLSIVAENSPAMQKGVDSITDYVPAGGAPDYSFTTGSTDAHFGFSPEGSDVVQAFLDNGSNACNQPGGSDTSLACWDGLSTTAAVIASATNANQPSGATTTVQFRVGVGGSVGVAPGEYVATTTLTAISL